MDGKIILDKIYTMYPNAGCELIYHNPFEFLCAVLLSAQTTDKAVNKITPLIFAKYKTPFDLKDANFDELKQIIEPIGLANNKTKYLIDLSKTICDKYNGEIPQTRKELESLPGVGRKTCNVYLSEIYHEPNIAVDTHVHRVSRRLGIVEDNLNVVETENALKKVFKKEDYIKAHHGLLFLGRYTCKSVKPNCGECLLNNICMKRNLK